MHWAKKTLVITLLFWLSVPVYATGPARLPFYEAHKGNIRFHILGTMHLGKNDPLREEITQALSKSSLLILELTKQDTAKAALLAISKMCKNPCLRQLLSPAAFTKLEARLPKGMTKTDLERTPAWMMGSILGIVDSLKAGLSPQFGTERHLMKIWGNRPTQGLETPEEQLDAFSSLEDSVQREMLESYLALSEEKILVLAEDLYQIWRNGDADALINWYNKSNKEQKLTPNTVKKLDEAMIVSRNNLMVERLQPHLAPDKPVFVAIGALHLGGDKGVLALLRKKGYTITQR